MSENPPGKYEKVQSKLDKTINPYVSVKIPIPQGADKEAFKRLEQDPDFIELIKNEAEKWLSKKGKNKEKASLI